MESTKTPSSRPEYDDARDLNFLLYKAAVETKKVFILIGRAILEIINGVKLILLFLFRNLIWMLLGFILGGGYGFYIYQKNGSKYYSEMIVKTNLNSANLLYKNIDYLNTLISSNNSNELGRILKISPKEVSKLYHFSIEPVKSELTTTELYRKYFLEETATRIRQDTFWKKTLPYKEFKKSLSNWDYPMHTVSAISFNPDIFSQLNYGVINALLKNEILLKYKQAQSENYNEDLRLLSSAVQGIDTLRRTYNERLLKGNTTASIYEIGPITGRNVTATAPELQLYDKLLELKDELKISRLRSASETNIVDIYSEFNSPGKEITSLTTEVLPAALTGLIAALSLVILISIIKIYRSQKSE